jgi:hypothetical protein
MASYGDGQKGCEPLSSIKNGANYVFGMRFSSRPLIWLNVSKTGWTGGIPMPDMRSFENLDAWFQQVRSIVMHPAFQQILTEIQNLPFEEGLQAAFTQLTPQVLTARNVPIPAGTLISIRASQDATFTPGGAAGRSIIARAQICLPLVPQWFDLQLLSSGGPMAQPPNW